MEDIIGKTNVFATRDAQMFRDTRRNAWIGEGVSHALLMLAARYESSLIAATLFAQVDKGVYGPDLRAELAAFKRFLPDELAVQVSDSLWSQNGCYLPMIVHQDEFNVMARRPTLASLAPPIEQRRLIVSRLTDFHAFFDAIADAMRAAVPELVPMATVVLGQIGLNGLNGLNGKIVTADALHMVKATASHIHEHGGEFVLPVKESRRALFDALDALPWGQVPIAHTATDQGHGRITTRTIQVLPAPEDLPFPHVSPIRPSSRPRPARTGGGTCQCHRARSPAATTAAMGCAGGMPGSGSAPDAPSRPPGADHSRRRHRRRPAGSATATCGFAAPHRCAGPTTTAGSSRGGRTWRTSLSPAMTPARARASASTARFPSCP